jgi:HD superfamily phosphohydrolase
MPKPKTIREAVHGDIELESHELDVVNTTVFQRLHGIKQLGMADVVYPTATHTRFEHALGCVHVAQRILDQLRRVGHEITTEIRERVRMAALLHDLAHISVWTHA